MPTAQVNLDALIPREDFAAPPVDAQPASARLPTEFNITYFERGHVTYSLLRKPDFQRETANWSPKKILEFLRSFLDGDLIPSVIMWRSTVSGNLFVIDGAHRLSALIAWVHDDYGDKELSKLYYGHNIPPEMLRLAVETRTLVEREIGTYDHLKYLVQNPASAKNDLMLRRAKNMGTFPVHLQWVVGNETAAEHSFFTINASATIIDETEIAVIKARKKPNAIATRALMRSGTGLRYHLGFPAAAIALIEELAREIYDLLFSPVQARGPIKTTDLPIASKSYTGESFKMLFDLVNLANGVALRTGKLAADGATLADDTDGSATVHYLRNVSRSALLITGDHPGSLGLHPIVYTYGVSGRFQPTAFLAAVAFFSELRQAEKLFEFTTLRRTFEEFLVRHRHFVNHLGRSYGSRTRPLQAITAMYRIVYDLLAVDQNRSDLEILDALLDDKRLRSLAEVVNSGKGQRTGARDAKSTAFLRDAIDAPVRCKQCGARLHSKSMTADHDRRREDGGTDDPDNLYWTHPYCNSGYKEAKLAREKRAVAP